MIRILFFLSCLLICCSPSREERLIGKGNLIVEKIEAYKTKHGSLPETLGDVGEKEDVNVDALYYYKRDNNFYTLHFGTVLGESVTYYSDSKKWEEIDR